MCQLTTFSVKPTVIDPSECPRTHCHDGSNETVFQCIEQQVARPDCLPCNQTDPIVSFYLILTLGFYEVGRSVV